jgi:hypothetical protein
MNGLENAGILDAIAHDPCSDKVLLAMYEARTWLNGQEQLFQLQEKLNAYVSFVLDGEMQEAYPALAGKSVEIQLRTVYEPSERALEFIGLAVNGSGTRSTAAAPPRIRINPPEPLFAGAFFVLAGRSSTTRSVFFGAALPCRRAFGLRFECA